MTFVSIVISAQPKTFKGTLQMNTQTNSEIVLAKSLGDFMPRPNVVIDKITKKETAVWSVPNFDWIKEHCGVIEPPIEKDYLKLFPEVSDMPLDEQPYMPMVKHFGTPAAYLKYSTKDEVKSLFATYDKYKVKSSRTLSDGAVKKTGTVSLEVSDTGKRLMGRQMEGNINWLDSISFDVEYNTTGIFDDYAIETKINDEHVMDLDVIQKNQPNELYITLPEFSNKSFYINENAYRELTGADSSVARPGNNLEAAAKASDLLETFTTRYFGIVIDSVKKVRRVKNVDVIAAGISEKTDKYIIELDKETYKRYLQKIYKYFGSDPEFRRLLEIIYESTGQKFRGMTPDEVVNFFRRNSKVRINAEKLNVPTGDLCSVYINSKGEVRGFETLMLADYGMNFSIMYPHTDEGARMEVKFGALGLGDFKIVGEDSELLQNTTAFTCYFNDVDICTVTKEELEHTDDGYTRLRSTIAPTEHGLEFVIDMLGLDDSALMLSGMAFSIYTETNGTQDKTVVDVMVNSESIMTVKADFVTEAGEGVTLPEDFIKYKDEKEVGKWVSEMNFNPLVSNLKKTKVPSEYVLTADAFTQSLKNLMLNQVLGDGTVTNPEELMELFENQALEEGEEGVEGEGLPGIGDTSEGSGSL